MNNTPYISNCTAEAIRDAALALKDGHLVAFPTETVYGLGADARNPDAIKRIYEVKGRPTDHPLIVHISSINQLNKWALEIPDYAISLARTFWPGPMTLILKRTDIVGDFITGGQDTVGLRVPSDPIALALLQEFEKISDSGVAAPSANRFGQVSPTSSYDVLEELESYLKDSDIVLHGGNSRIGIESTIIDCTNRYPRILRPGFTTNADIAAVIELDPNYQQSSIALKHSGSFDKHYAPKCRVELKQENQSGAGFFAMKAIETPQGMFRLASPETTEEFANILYSTLRRADQLGLGVLVVAPPQEEGIGVAILDRLNKASNGSN
jgi:L-threonylcarbamoyladenylate synthase